MLRLPHLCILATLTLLLASRPAFIHAETTRHDFGDDVVAEVYKEASGDKLWIYRFSPQVTDPHKPHPQSTESDSAKDTNETDSDGPNTKRPAVVFFFGGGWNGGTVTQFEQHSRYLAARGIVAFVADYRVKSRQKTGPDACVADGKSAVRWLRKNAVRLGLDPNRIAAGGGSAGGHVAATTGICDGLDEPGEDESVSSKSNALILFNPVYDNGPDGYGYDRAKDWFPQISPAHNITKDDPPTIVFLGSKDKLIPVSTAEKFQHDLETAGITGELHVYDGQPHGFFNESKNQDAFLDTVRKMDAFLVKLGWLAGDCDEAKLKSLLSKPERNATTE